MAEWKNPKTDWVTNPKNPVAEDFNRIEGNIDFLKQDIETKKGIIVDALNTVGLDTELTDTHVQIANKITNANQGTKVITPGTSNITIPKGFHSGQGYVVGDPDLKPENIALGKSIFGVNGSLSYPPTILNAYRLDYNVHDYLQIGYYDGWDGYGPRFVTNPYRIEPQCRGTIDSTNQNPSHGVIVTKNKVNLTNISYIVYVYFCIRRDTQYHKSYLAVSNNQMTNFDDYVARAEVSTGEGTYATIILDVSSLTGEYYIKLGPTGIAGGYHNTVLLTLALSI